MSDPENPESAECNHNRFTRRCYECDTPLGDRPIRFPVRAGAAAAEPALLEAAWDEGAEVAYDMHPHAYPLAVLLAKNPYRKP